ncbi:dihydrodipicolinate synthase family protein [Nocardia sp. BMG51109]|uniref:dihydrodipicolinate synthase family protein n=1 Tax=Nocardia sp. BMG51109 TaxID=1056816 RepID=UPI0004658EE8|nr:dihydrodipicolinate synthase family protein [Nocardia sp. BMG51109]
MNRHDVEWSGYWPAAPTPFAPDGALDESALAALMELYARHRVNGVLINGSTGEWFSQSPEERREVARIAVEAVAGRFPVVVGVTAYTPDEAVALARHAERIGADGVLATPPPYVHPSPDEIVAYYRDVSSATSLPFMVYNWPRGVAVDMGATPGLLRRLAELDRVVAIKDSTGNWLGMLDTVEQLSSEVRVFGSFLHRRGLAVLRNLGGDGNIDGGGVGAPFAVPYYRAALGGDRDAAAMWADRYQSLSGKLIRPDYSGVFASPIPQLKAVMSILGQPGGHVRPPLLPFGGDGAALERVVAESGIAEAAGAVDA